MRQGAGHGACRTRNAEYGMRNTEYGIWNTECGIRNAERGVRNAGKPACACRRAGRGSSRRTARRSICQLRSQQRPQRRPAKLCEASVGYRNRRQASWMRCVCCALRALPHEKRGATPCHPPIEGGDPTNHPLPSTHPAWRPHQPPFTIHSSSVVALPNEPTLTA
eukprot:366429-Chlamydomonas_euryale.AAC.5